MLNFMVCELYSIPKILNIRVHVYTHTHTQAHTFHDLTLLFKMIINET